MIRLWRLYQGGMYGGGMLPQAGGVMEQSIVMMDAFAFMNATEAEIRKKP